MFAGLLFKLKTFFMNKITLYAIGFFIAVLVLITLFNADTVLSKFGFETKTTLAKEVVKTTEQLKQATEINKDLNDKIEDLTKTTEKTIQVITDNSKDKQKSQNVINDNKNKADKLRAEIGDIRYAINPNDFKELDTLKLKLDTTIESYSKEDVRKLSAVNIGLINKTHHDLFGD